MQRGFKRSRLIVRIARIVLVGNEVLLDVTLHCHIYGIDIALLVKINMEDLLFDVFVRRVWYGLSLN